MHALSYVFILYPGDGEQLSAFAENFINTSYPQLVKELESAGWITSHLLLGAGEWKYHWDADRNI